MVMTCQIRLAIFSLRVPLFGVLRVFNAPQLIVSNECAHCQTPSCRRPNVGSLHKAEMERRKKRLRRGAERQLLFALSSSTCSVHAVYTTHVVCTRVLLYCVLYILYLCSMAAHTVQCTWSTVHWISSSRLVRSLWRRGAKQSKAKRGEAKAPDQSASEARRTVTARIALTDGAQRGGERPPLRSARLVVPACAAPRRVRPHCVECE